MVRRHRRLRPPRGLLSAYPKPYAFTFSIKKARFYCPRSRLYMSVLPYMTVPHGMQRRLDTLKPRDIANIRHKYVSNRKESEWPT